MQLTGYLLGFVFSAPLPVPALHSSRGIRTRTSLNTCVNGSALTSELWRLKNNTFQKATEEWNKKSFKKLSTHHQTSTRDAEEQTEQETPQAPPPGIPLTYGGAAERVQFKFRWGKQFHSGRVGWLPYSQRQILNYNVGPIKTQELNLDVISVVGSVVTPLQGRLVRGAIMQKTTEYTKLNWDEDGAMALGWNYLKGLRDARQRLRPTAWRRTLIHLFRHNQLHGCLRSTTSSLRWMMKTPELEQSLWRHRLQVSEA